MNMLYTLNSYNVNYFSIKLGKKGICYWKTKHKTMNKKGEDDKTTCV